MKKAKQMQQPPHDNIVEMLRYLKLPFSKEHYEELAQTAIEEAWAPVKYLEVLLQGETDLREQHGEERRMRHARFPVSKCIEHFDFTWPKKINRQQIMDLFRFKFIAERSNVILMGGVGLGKSHLAVAIGQAACKRGHTVLFSTAVDIVNALAASQAAGRFSLELKKYLRVELLIIDELGYLPIDKRGADLLFQVISKRYEKGSIVITTNKPFKAWAELFSNDSTLTSAVLDRLLHHAQTAVIEGNSFRMKGRIEEEEG